MWVRFNVLSVQYYDQLKREQDKVNDLHKQEMLLDRRLGVSDKSSKCETCGMGLQDCPGHFGRIKLELPVFHVGYFKPLVAVLQCICKTCSRVLLPKPKKASMALVSYRWAAPGHNHLEPRRRFLSRVGQTAACSQDPARATGSPCQSAGLESAERRKLDFAC